MGGFLAAAMAIILSEVPAARGAAAESTIQIIPQPLSIQPAAGVFTLTSTTVIMVRTPALDGVGRYLSDLLAPATGIRLVLRASGAERRIVLQLDPGLAELGPEGYTLECTPAAVTLSAAKPAGVFYAVQTLRQLLPIQIESRQPVADVAWSVPCVSIKDQPRLGWRGYLLDPARHFRTPDELKRMIDLLAMQKLNVMQLHLTDDQGWRIEIKKYPGLTETGARLADCSGKKGDNWFYRQAEIKELVAYAALRQVTLVPEIEMPGHSGAATAAYPELACGGTPSSALCVSRERTCEFARDVLDEVLALFPSPYVHIGADEVAPARWRACPQCKARMEVLAQTALPAEVKPYRLQAQIAAGLPFQEDIARLQGEFVRNIDRHLTSKGRRMTGWDEIIEGGLQADSRAVVMAWRGAEAVTGATGQQRDVVVTLYPDLYLDNATPLERTYAFEPVPSNIQAGQAARVIGVQGNMWGEATPTLQRVEQQTFPRLCAIAEIGWSARPSRNFQDFSTRLASFRRRLELMGVGQIPREASAP